MEEEVRNSQFSFHRIYFGLLQNSSLSQMCPLNIFIGEPLVLEMKGHFLVLSIFKWQEKNIIMALFLTTNQKGGKKHVFFYDI